MSVRSPDALRARFEKLIEEGLSGPAAALRLKFSPATRARWGLSIRRTRQARAAPQGRPRGKGKLNPHRSIPVELIDQESDMTIPELAGALADATCVQAHPYTIGGLLHKLGFSYKKGAGSDRETAHKGKEAARQLDCPRPARCLGPTRSRCLH